MKNFIDKLLQPYELICGCTYSYDSDGKIAGGYFSIYQKETQLTVSSFKLVPMSGCGGVIISCNVSVEPDFRNKGYGTLLSNIREQMAVELRYSAMVCTVIDGNTFQQRIMEKNGWQKSVSFLNSKTGNNIIMYTKILNDGK